MNEEAEGLSPRVRGHQEEIFEEEWRDGSIPTCAGASPLARRQRATREVYPHVCGGIVRPFRPNRPVKGLSPRVRGHRFSG